MKKNIYEANGNRRFLDEQAERELLASLLWLGFPLDSDIDYCDDGSAYVGLTQVLPRKGN